MSAMSSLLFRFYALYRHEELSGMFATRQRTIYNNLDNLETSSTEHSRTTGNRQEFSYSRMFHKLPDRTIQNVLQHSSAELPHLSTNRSESSYSRKFYMFLLLAYDVTQQSRPAAATMQVYDVTASIVTANRHQTRVCGCDKRRNHASCRDWITDRLVNWSYVVFQH